MKTIHGMKIVDAKKPLEVVIKPGDVRRAGVQDPAKCAAAQALCRDPNITEARVHISRAYVRRKGTQVWERYQTPLQLRTGIVAFDKGATKAFDVDNSFILMPARPATGKQQGTKKGQNVKRGPKEKRTYILTHIRPNANCEFDLPKGK